MSKFGSKKETILKVYIRKFPRSLENIIGMKIENASVKNELYMFQKFIDLFAVTRDQGIKVYTEFQIRHSDKYDHLETKIRPLVNNIQDGIIVWVAKEFRSGHIDLVKDLLNKNPNKKINFFAAKIHPKVLKVLEKLNKDYHLDLWDNLDVINDIDEPLLLVDSYLKMPTSYSGESYTKKRVYNFSDVIDRNKYLLDQLREKIPYFLNFHFEKNAENNKTLRAGAGRDELYYEASLYDDEGNAFVQICFGKSKKEWYRMFKLHKELLEEKISPKLQLNDRDRKISFSIESDSNNIPKITNQIVGVFEKFIGFFSPFTYGNKNPKEFAAIILRQSNEHLLV